MNKLKIRDGNLASSHAFFYLLSFSPANGIGFYESSNSLHVLDLLAAQDLQVEADVAGYILTLAGHQLESGATFSSKEAMFEYMRREYLRDKKNNYYAEILTSRMDGARRLQMLSFLNDEKLKLIQVSKAFVQMMKKLCDPEIVASVIQIVQEHGLANVQQCLETDFHHIITDLESLELLSVDRGTPRLKG